MGRLEVKIVAGSVKVCWHGRKEIAAVLSTIAITHFDAADLGERIRLVGWLQRARQQVLFPNRLWTCLGIDAGTPQVKQPPHANLPTGMNHIGVDHRVLVEKFGRIVIVGVNPTHFSCGQQNNLGAMLSHP